MGEQDILPEEDRSQIPATMKDIDTLINILVIHNEVDDKIHTFLETLDGDIKALETRIEELENKVQ